MKKKLQLLSDSLQGTLQFDSLIRTLYATDASVYQELPLAVAFPKNKEDLKKIIFFANQNQVGIIPRTAGTSLAGQCVGDGIVVDVSKHFNRILEFKAEENWVIVEPGVIRDELNAFLKPHGLFFSPITSTANRAMIGGMVGNNSSGTTSIEYGTTRDHVLELHTLVSDGTEVIFKNLDRKAFQEKCNLENLEGHVYQQIARALATPAIQKAIQAEFPKATIHRRNTGYAVDALLDFFNPNNNIQHFNFCKLLCGSEGTLAFTTKIKLHLDPLPLPKSVIVCAHFSTIRQSLEATQMAMKFAPSKCELMDKIILDCTSENLLYRPARFFLEGDPEGVLMVEFRGGSEAEARAKAAPFIDALKAENLGYAYPIVSPEKTDQVWQLRSAGLGLLANIPGDKKAVACIEDTAVDLADLPDYIDEVSAMMDRFGQRSVYYAHAGAGELHMRPILNLKDPVDVQQFYDISAETASLVKKYQGSLSGEHGDGRLRAAFIEQMVGPINYQLFKDIKQTWDPSNVFNPGKIVDAPPMNQSLRYQPGQQNKAIETLFDFSHEGGILLAAEKCNGSGDCRKLPLSGGTMCPSYMATRNEQDTTRGRANTLRHFLTLDTSENPFDQVELKTVMDLCISCKGCKSECPSNVDMATMKAEFLYQYYQTNGTPLRAQAFARINQLNKLGSLFTGFTNFLFKNSLTSSLLKKILSVAPQRSLPLLSKRTLRSYYKKNVKQLKVDNPIKTVYLFCDEFTNFNDTKIGIDALQLLSQLGYQVELLDHFESGRAAISKGLLKMAKRCAIKNVEIFRNKISKDKPLIGIEPSAILSFRDEYPRLVGPAQRVDAKALAKNCLLIDEFLATEIRAGNIRSDQFTKASKHIILHGHCHQKALSKVADSAWILSLPENYTVEMIPSGCCGMAGSFGYEKEHYDISMQIGALVLFPAVKQANAETIIAAPGTSCRHQIMDGTSREASHPVSILWNACEG